MWPLRQNLPRQLGVPPPLRDVTRRQDPRPRQGSRGDLYLLLRLEDSFEEMKNTLIHNCIGSHTNCFKFIL